MKEIKAFLVRFADCVMHTVPIATLLSVILFYLCAVGYIVLSDSISALVLIGLMLGLNIGCIFIMSLARAFTATYKYDADIIGSEFAGLSRKSRAFGNALELYSSHRYHMALDAFMDMDRDFGDILTQTEKSLICFYTARCYDIMKFYPNALMNYVRAKELGFCNKVLPFLTARCTGENGDVDEALRLFAEVRSDRESSYADYVPTNIGSMFLSRNEPEKALEWFTEAINNRQDYASALGGAAIAHILLGNTEKSRELLEKALLNHVADPAAFINYYKSIYDSAMLDKKQDN